VTEPISASEIKAARSVAKNIAFFGGPDLSGMSDEALVLHLRGAGTRMKSAFERAGLSAAELGNAFQRMSVALRHA